MQISEINLRDPRVLMVLFYEGVTNTMGKTSTAWNICASAAPEFSRIFRRGIPQTCTVFPATSRTVNVEPFKNRAFKSNDVSPRRHQSWQREAPTRFESEEGKKDEEALKRGSRKGGETVPFSDSRRESRWKAGGRADGRAQRWGKVFRSGKGSICRHNFTGIACQECRWKVDYCFSIRYASSASRVFIKWAKIEGELRRVDPPQTQFIPLFESRRCYTLHAYPSANNTRRCHAHQREPMYG